MQRTFKTAADDDVEHDADVAHREDVAELGRFSNSQRQDR